ncbi:MAG: hypothetical protein AAGI52_12045 [Bacteroidota bacterium]
MRSPLPAVALAALLSLSPALSGCDESIPTAMDDLLTDARIARQAGDLGTAVNLLERAHEADQGDAVVRVELASSLFEQADLNVADLDRIATYLLEEGQTLAPTGPVVNTVAKGDACPYETDPGAESFDPRDFEEYGDYLENAQVARRVRELLDPIITSELRPDDFLCTGIQDGALVYDSEAALSALRGVDPDITDQQIASALAVNSVAEVLDTYLFLTEELAGQADWYRLGDGSIGVCPVGISEEELRDLAEPSIADMGEALLSVDLRSRLIGSSTDLVDIVLDAYEEVRNDLAPTCSGS